MTELDTLARAASSELLERTTPDVRAGLTGLRRTRTRRAGAKTLAVTAVLAVAVGGWRLTDHPDRTVQPAPAVGELADGPLLALPVEPDGASGPWLVALGDSPGFVPRDGAAGTAYQVTADGATIVYADSTGHVQALDHDTGAIRTLADCPEDICEVALSPDGDVLAASDGDGVLLSDLGSDHTRRIAAPGAELGGPPAWSPDGSQLALTSADGIAVVDVDSGRVSHPVAGTLEGQVVGPVAWSPDGESLAYLTRAPVTEDQGRFLVTVADLARDRTTALFDAGTCTCAGVAFGRPAPTLAWSPDGTRVAVTTTRDAELPRGLYLLHPTGPRQPELVARGSYAALAWLPG